MEIKRIYKIICQSNEFLKCLKTILEFKIQPPNPPKGGLI
jgi:hypothetical protein